MRVAKGTTVPTMEELASSSVLLVEGLLMLETNLERCSKWRVISVASTMSTTCCRTMRKSSLKGGGQVQMCKRGLMQLLQRIQPGGVDMTTSPGTTILGQIPSEIIF